jgi:hypothetical protein
MVRPRVAAGILGAVTLLAVTPVLLMSRPSGVEMLLRSAGTVKYYYRDHNQPGTRRVQLVHLTVDLTEHPASETALFKELRRQGWKTIFSGRVSGADWCNMYSPDPQNLQQIQFYSFPDHCRAEYDRKPTLTEQASHWIKGMLHMPDYRRVVPVR